MSRLLRTRPILVLFLIFAGVALVSSMWGPADDPTDWRADLEAARSEASASNKPLLVYFTADWCGPCQQMKGRTFPTDPVQEMLANFVPVKIDVDQQPQIAAQYNASAIPMMLIVDASGEVRARHVGYIDAPALVQWLQENLISSQKS